MIILRQKEFGFPKGLIPFYNTFKNIGSAGKSIIKGDFKNAGKNTLKAGGHALLGAGKIVGGSMGVATLGAYGIGKSIDNSFNDMEEKFNYHNK